MRTLLHFKNSYHRPLPNVPFTYGVPIPEGIAKTTEDIALLDVQSTPVPVSVQTRATWPDGSIRWALLDFCGDFVPSQESDWTLAIGEGVDIPLPEQPVVVRETGESFLISNGPIRAVFSFGKPFSIVHALRVEGVDIIDFDSRCDIVATNPNGKIFRASYDPRPQLSLEDVTQLRATVRWDGGLFAGDSERMTEFITKSLSR